MIEVALHTVRAFTASITVWTAINLKWGKTTGIMPSVFPHLV